MKLFNETGKVSFDKVRNKIAKLLRLQTSNNAGEAANAAAFVEKLCAKYNVSSSDCQDYDPNRDEVIEFASGKSYVKANVPEQTLIYAVARYFNGRTIITYEHEGLPYYLAPDSPRKVLKIIASRGNKIQIELYLEYLIEVMNKLATEAKKSGVAGTRSTTYKTNWKKGFATRIANRLMEMKRQQQEDGRPELNQPALVVADKNAIENKASLAFLDENYPNRRTTRRNRTCGVGYADGREKAESIGLNKQTKGSQQTLALSGN